MQHGISIRSSVRGFLALALLAAATAPASNAQAQTNGVSQQTAELYEMQAAFHRSLTVHDPVNGDSSDVVTQRIKDMLSLWTDGAELYLHGFGSIDGYYVGKGDPDDASSCPEPSGAVGQVRGTLCSYFKYFAGSMQQANKFIVLTPSYITTFDVHGDNCQGALPMPLLRRLDVAVDCEDEDQFLFQSAEGWGQMALFVF